MQKKVGEELTSYKIFPANGRFRWAFPLKCEFLKRLRWRGTLKISQTQLGHDFQQILTLFHCDLNGLDVFLQFEPGNMAKGMKTWALNCGQGGKPKI